MLRRVAGVRVGRVLSATATAAAPPLSRLPVLSATRTFASRSDDESKKSAASSTQSAAAAAVAAASSNTAAAATAAQVFATNERSKPNGNEDGSSSHAQKETVNPKQQQPQLQQQQQESPTDVAPPAATSGIRSIGIKLSKDDELVRAFNNFSKSVNGCTQNEFLVGVKQAYASLAVVISAFVDKAQVPLVGLTESSKVIAAAHEASKLLDQEFKPDGRENAQAKTAAAAAAAAAAIDNVESTPIGTAAVAAKVKGGAASAAESGAAAATAANVTSTAASPKARLQDTLVQHVVNTITSIIPVSRHLAESIFKIWILQKDKQVNLSSIASPSDYILDSKLVVFARLDRPRIYFNSDNIGAEVDVTMNNDYLRKLDPATNQSVAQGAAKQEGGNSEDVEEGMIEVLTDTTANAQSNVPQEHTFLVDKKTRRLTQTGPAGAAGATMDMVAAAGTAVSSSAAPVAAVTGTDAPSATGKGRLGGKGATVSRVQVTCASTEDRTARANASAAGSPGGVEAAKTAVPSSTEASAEEDAVECSVFIKVNGNALPPIPADARACALLTVDVVVPPERYAYNFEWFYKRIIGYENEYERIAAARVFASNSPKSLGNALDFVMRMITGKSVEFMFTKSIGRIIGIPEDVSETPPATRKLVCMYMDATYKWVLADLITLAPVIETKLPKA